MQNLENLDIFEILITEKLLNARKTLFSDPRLNACEHMPFIQKRTRRPRDNL